MKRGKKGEPKPYTGLEALLVFPDHGDYVATLDLMRRFSAAMRYGYNRLLEGEDRRALKKEDGPLCTLFRLNTRYADDALLKAQALLTAQRELRENPRKVVFGGRKLLADLARLKRSNLPLYERKKAEWRERRKGTLYARGDRTKGGNLNLRLVVREGSLFGAPTPQMNLQDPSFHTHVRNFYEGRIADLKERYLQEENPYLKRRLGRELAQMRKALATLPSLQGEPGGPAGSTAGRNPQGIHAWRALRVGLFLPLLGQRVPRDLSALKPILLGSWEGWKGRLDPSPGMGSAAAAPLLHVGGGSGG